jgi:hypothetical protein
MFLVGLDGDINLMVLFCEKHNAYLFGDKQFRSARVSVNREVLFSKSIIL